MKDIERRILKSEMYKIENVVFGGMLILQGQEVLQLYVFVDNFLRLTGISSHAMCCSCISQHVFMSN